MMVIVMMMIIPTAAHDVAGLALVTKVLAPLLLYSLSSPVLEKIALASIKRQKLAGLQAARSSALEKRTEQSRDDEPTTDEQTIIKCNDFPQNPSKDGFSQGTKNRESSSTALTRFVPFRLDLIQVEPNQNKSIQKKEFV